jgi:hypothetical protein
MAYAVALSSDRKIKFIIELQADKKSEKPNVVA